jgi:hypothetical protein
MIELLPIVGGMHEGRVSEVAEAVAEIHFYVPVFFGSAS